MEDESGPPNDPGPVPGDESQARGSEAGAADLHPVEGLPGGDPDLPERQDLKMGRVGGAQDEHQEGVVVHDVGGLRFLKDEAVRLHGL
jgi:hypothetical protein